MNRKFAPTLFLVAFSACSTFAQNSTTKPKNEAIEKLVAALEGNWSIQITLAGNEKHPGSDGHGKEEYYRGPGRKTFIEKYHSVGKEGEVTGLGIFWPDEKSNGYQILWCDNENSGGCVPMEGGGAWEGESLVLRQSFQQDGKKVEMKEVFSDFTPSSFRQTIFQRINSGEWKVTVTIHATRVKDRANN